MCTTRLSCNSFDPPRPIVCTCCVFVALFLSTGFCNAAPANLRVIAASAAAVVRRVIPASQAEVQDRTGVVKMRTRLVPRQDTPGRMEVPDSYGAMFIIRVEPGPYKGPRLSNTPRFEDASGSPVTTKLHTAKMVGAHQQQDAYLRLLGCFRTATMQEFRNRSVVMIVEILYGSYTDRPMLRRAYAELTSFMATEVVER
jgi:hypothetical protein